VKETYILIDADVHKLAWICVRK